MKLLLLLLLTVTESRPQYDESSSSVPFNGAGGIALSGACATQVTGDVVCYDNNGVAGGQRTDTTDPDELMIRPQACWPGDGTCVAADINSCPGQDTTTTAIDGADPSVSCAGDNDTVTVTVVTNSGVSTATVLTEGTDWTATASVADTCASLATAVSALAGVSATCTSPDVRIQLDTTTCRVTLAESTAGCTTVAVGTRADNVNYGTASYGDNANAYYLENAASSATNPTLVPDRASLTAGIGGTSGDVSIITGGSERINFDTAGLITTAASLALASPMRLNDNIDFTIGTSDDASIGYSTEQTPDALLITPGADSRGVIICESADRNVDFGHGLQTNPTLFVHSADATNTAQWISLAHNQTDGVLDVGTGVVSVPDGITSSSTSAYIATSTTTMGWTVASAANQACNTTCTSACVMGMDTAALGNFLACTDGTADTCLCAGP